MKTSTQCTDYCIPESKEECEEIECDDCLYSHEQPWKCFENNTVDTKEE
jgi:hypothetical protein